MGKWGCLGGRHPPEHPQPPADRVSPNILKILFDRKRSFKYPLWLYVALGDTDAPDAFWLDIDNAYMPAIIAGNNIQFEEK